MRATVSFMFRPATSPRWLECTSRAANFSNVRLIPFATRLWTMLLGEMGLKPPGSTMALAVSPRISGEGLGINTSSDSLKSAGKAPSRIAWRYKL